jgi:hypothetical protein
METQSRRGRGFIAVCAGLAVTGLGHLVVGRFHRAAKWFIAWAMLNAAIVVAACLPRLSPGLILLAADRPASAGRDAGKLDSWNGNVYLLATISVEAAVLSSSR